MSFFVFTGNFTPVRVEICWKGRTKGEEMKVNGKEKRLKEPMTISGLLESMGYKSTRVAVEKNGEIISKTDYDLVFVSEADQLEIVSFVGGG